MISGPSDSGNSDDLQPIAFSNGIFSTHASVDEISIDIETLCHRTTAKVSYHQKLRQAKVLQ